jgi:PAS domain S-box-containing protein
MKQFEKIQTILAKIPSGTLPPGDEKRLELLFHQLRREYGHLKSRFDYSIREKAIIHALLEKTTKDLVDRYQTIFENAGIPMIIINDEGRIILANSHFSEMMDCTNKINEEDRNFYSYISHSERDKLTHYHIERRNESTDNSNQYETQIVDRFGKIRDVILNIGYLPNSSGSVISILDVTERNQQRNELTRQNEKLNLYQDHLEELVKERTSELAIAKEIAESANHAKSSFLSSISHELRTPLNAILGYTQILKRKNLDSETLQGLDIIEKSGKHLLTLITDILDLTKIEAGRMELIPEPIYFSPFLTTILNIIRTRADSKGLQLLYQCDGDLPQVIISDETRLRQILINLLGNAVKYTDTGSILFQIKCIDKYPSNPTYNTETMTRLLFSVSDTGTGINQNQMDRLFKPFEQIGDPTHWKEGTGLGLSISRQLVEIMGGELKVKSQPGVGSTFWFEITVPVGNTNNIPEEVIDLPIIGYAGKRKNILVIDDILSNRMVINDFLTPLGFSVVQAGGGREAIRYLTSILPDLILMDILMPDMDGFSCIQEIKKLPGTEKIPIIAMSANVFNEVKEKVAQAGFQDFLLKPVIWTQLSSLLASHLHITWEYLLNFPTSNIQSLVSENDLIPPQAEILRNLVTLTRSGDVGAILDMATQIHAMGHEFEPFADRISDLAHAFEIKEIQSFIIKYLPDYQF